MLNSDTLFQKRKEREKEEKRKKKRKKKEKEKKQGSKKTNKIAGERRSMSIAVKTAENHSVDGSMLRFGIQLFSLLGTKELGSLLNHSLPFTACTTCLISLSPRHICL